MTYSSPAFDVEYSLETDARTACVSGTIVNKLDREVSTVLLSFHFYDAEEVRLSQEQLFVNEIEPGEKVRFMGNVILGSGAIESVRLVKAEPIPLSDYPEAMTGETDAGDAAEQPRH
ncbi:MAG TPA: FxLYD domain-containing protein [Candidatus Kapabacteria bacterium]|jgi:hypothetical protein|nr:FxLYD domain-containing protein [Candidatus Kapabacteria bacterium]